jgi:hypothetical protein
MLPIFVAEAKPSDTGRGSFFTARNVQFYQAHPSAAPGVAASKKKIIGYGVNRLSALADAWTHQSDDGACALTAIHALGWSC